MEPFAKKPAQRLQLHWWIVAGVAAAFFVWSFDLIPRVRSAATGTVAATKSQTQPPGKSAGYDSSMDADWSLEVNELDGDDSGISPFASDDPMGYSTAASRKDTQNEPDDVEKPAVRQSSGRRTNERQSRPRSGVAMASYESPQTVVPTDRRGVSPSRVISSEVAARLRVVEEWLQDDQILDAHAELSKIYWKHPELRTLIQDQIDQTAAIIFTTSDRQFGPPHFVEYGETLEGIAKQYDVPWEYLAMLNRVTAEKLQAGQELKVVRGPFGAVVDLADFTLTVHAHGWYINHYRIGTGADQKTPLGEFVVQDKLENPTWYNPDGGIVDPDDPENPLGEYWLGLGNHIGIHGTNEPATIGKAASRGCIHLGDDDIAEVYSLLSTGSKVLIRR